MLSLGLSCVCVCVCVCVCSVEASRWGSCTLNGVCGSIGGSREQSWTLIEVCVLGCSFSAWPATAACSGEEGCSVQGSRRRGWWEAAEASEYRWARVTPAAVSHWDKRGAGKRFASWFWKRVRLSESRSKHYWVWIAFIWKKEEHQENESWHWTQMSREVSTERMRDEGKVEQWEWEGNHCPDKW